MTEGESWNRTVTREPSRGEKLPSLLLRMCPESWKSLSRWWCLEQAGETGDERCGESGAGIKSMGAGWEKGHMKSHGRSAKICAQHAAEQGVHARRRSWWPWGMSLILLICSRIKGTAESISQAVTKQWQEITSFSEGKSV